MSIDTTNGGLSLVGDVPVNAFLAEIRTDPNQQVI